MRPVGPPLRANAVPPCPIRIQHAAGRRAGMWNYVFASLVAVLPPPITGQVWCLD